jgi:hypothetical protein
MNTRTLDPETTTAERACIVDLLRKGGLSGKHLEIGTAAGGTLALMMSAYPAERRPPFVVVDPFTYFRGQRDAVDQNLRCAGVDPASVDFRVGFSFPVLQRALPSGERFSFIFIDGNHNTPFVMQDLMWTRLLDVGGYVCLHDYTRKFRGVIWSVEHFLRRYPNYRKVAAVDTLVVLQKQSESTRPEVSGLDIALAKLLRHVHRGQWSLDKRLGRTHRPLNAG